MHPLGTFGLPPSGRTLGRYPFLSAWPAITLVDDNKVTIGCINRQPEQSFAVVIALADNKESQLHYDRASDAGGTPNGPILKVAINTHPHKQDFVGFTRS